MEYNLMIARPVGSRSTQCLMPMGMKKLESLLHSGPKLAFWRAAKSALFPLGVHGALIGRSALTLVWTARHTESGSNHSLIFWNA